MTPYTHLSPNKLFLAKQRCMFLANSAFSIKMRNISKQNTHSSSKIRCSMRGRLNIYWKSMEINENLWDPRKPMKSYRQSIENLLKICWKPIGHRLILYWKSMEINENQWKSMNIHYRLWKIYEIPENHWKSIENLLKIYWKSIEILLKIYW